VRRDDKHVAEVPNFATCRQAHRHGARTSWPRLPAMDVEIRAEIRLDQLRFLKPVR
jgi:hypothetical protein